MIGTLPSTDSLATLLRLIDDETPQVRASVASALHAFNGDVSELLADTGIRPSTKDRLTLSRLLSPARRQRLLRDWIVPAEGIQAFDEDWERFEGMLRLLSDFLHDGITLRQPLSDALDLLAEECEPAVAKQGAFGLITELLQSERLKADPSGEHLSAHYDLAAVIAGAPTTALGLGLILLLVAQRLDCEIVGINIPGGFLCRLHRKEQSIFIEPSQKEPIDGDELNHRIRNYPPSVVASLMRSATPGDLLLRILDTLATAFATSDEPEDSQLMEDLMASLTLDS